MVETQERQPVAIVARSVRQPLRAFLRERSVERFIVLCDANVESYAQSLVRGIRGCLRVMPFALGERRKTLAAAQRVLEALARAGSDRRTLVIGVGGGIAADLFGFAASIFMRGVPYAHVATSLLAMCDAAIGGKTAVNLEAGKNLAGSFADPVAIFAWIDALRTLPFRHLREGLAEVVKAAIIEGGDFFEGLETLAPHPFERWPWETIVTEAQRVKFAIVNDDREEHGMRELLNLGHTFGHAIERASRYRVTHGAGVAIGLRGAGLLALRTGRFSREDHLRILTLLTLLRLPTVTSEAPDEIVRTMRYDKKKRGEMLRFVLPRAIGDVEYGVTVPPASVRRVLRRLGQPPGAREFDS